MSFENRPQSSKPEKRGREIALFAQLPVNIQPRKLGGGIRQANHTRIKKFGGTDGDPTGVDARNLSYGRLLALI